MMQKRQKEKECETCRCSQEAVPRVCSPGGVLLWLALHGRGSGRPILCCFHHQAHWLQDQRR